MQDKQIKLSAIAIVIALLAISQTNAISSLYNYHFFNGTNISIIDDGFGNITISTNASSGHDNTKLNNTGDNIYQGTLYINEKPLYATTNLTLGDNVGLRILSNVGNTLLCSSWNKYVTSCSLEDVNLSDYNNNYNFVNNSTVDKKLSNYTNNYNWVNNSTMAADNSKVNKSGDNMTGRLLIVGQQPIRDVVSDLVVLQSSSGQSGLFISSIGTAGSYFSGGMLRGSIQSPQNLVNNDNIFNLGATGSRENGLVNTASINMRASQNWNNTSAPSKLTFSVTNINAVGRRETIVFNSTGNIELLIVGKGFQTISPDGNIWCTTTSNAGINVVTSGICS